MKRFTTILISFIFLMGVLVGTSLAFTLDFENQQPYFWGNVMFPNDFELVQVTPNVGPHIGVTPATDGWNNLVTNVIDGSHSGMIWANDEGQLRFGITNTHSDPFYLTGFTISYGYQNSHSYLPDELDIYYDPMIPGANPVLWTIISPQTVLNGANSYYIDLTGMPTTTMVYIDMRGDWSRLTLDDIKGNLGYPTPTLPANTVPEPSTVAMILSGIIGLIPFRRKIIG